MSRISYDFDRSSIGPNRSRDPKRIFRVLLIFCIVAAVTVGAIFLIVPKKQTSVSAGGKPEKELSGQKEASLLSNDSGEEKASNVAVSPETTSVHPQEGNSGESSLNSGAESAEGKKETADASSSGKSGKGVILPDDPAAAEDQPLFPPNRTPDADAALEKIRSASSPSEKIRAAEAFMLNEAKNGGEFSRCFLAAGQLLAKANAEAPTFSSYKVVRGDFLERIARKNKTTVEKIRRDNKLKNDRIGIGQELKIFSAQWEVRISRSARVLTLWCIRDGKRIPYAAYPVGIGRKGSTPLGDFTIAERQYHPKWKDREKREYPYGDPKNPLGVCFLVFNRRNMGIHGTADDRSVGRSLSNGCVRMLNDDAETLYLLLPEKTPVKIVE